MLGTIQHKLTTFYKILTQYKTLFFTGLVLKLLLGTFFASDYLVHLFTPFLKYGTNISYFGAYDYFQAYGRGNEFPYPSMMQLVLSIPKWLFSFFSSKDASAGFIDLFSIRLSLLIADTVIFYILLQWLRHYRKAVMLLYWLSPVLFYINYVHGQLDVIPVAFLMVSLYYLFKHQFITAVIFLALAIGCKTSMFMAVPFVFIYGYKSAAIVQRNFVQAIILFVLLLIVVNYPLFYSSGYYKMVFQNEEQKKIFSTFFNITGSSLFLLIPALYLILILRFSMYWQMSRSLLLMYLGFAFGLITIFINANQGWYYWCFPFFIYFIVKFSRIVNNAFLLISIFYFVHFGFITNSDFYRVFQLVDAGFSNSANWFSVFQQKGMDATLLSNIVSTLLQASIIAFCYFIYKYGLSQIKYNKMLYQPYIVGISGDSATGKTTVAEMLQKLFKKTNATIINGDDMHKWERGNDNYKTYTHLNPKANHLHQNLFHFLQLLKGNKIERKHYDHDSGTFTEAQKISSSKIIIFEGLHTYYLDYQKALFDLKIFMKPNEDLRTEWKLHRDAHERGHSVQDVLVSIASRKPDADAYVLQQETDAEVVVSFQKNNSDTKELLIKCLNHFYLDELLEQLSNAGLTVEHRYENQFQYLRLEGTIDDQLLKEAQHQFSDTLEELGFGEVVWQKQFDGVLQLILTQIILYKLQLEVNLNQYNSK